METIIKAKVFGSNTLGGSKGTEYEALFTGITQYGGQIIDFQDGWFGTGRLVNNEEIVCGTFYELPRAIEKAEAALAHALDCKKNYPHYRVGAASN